jgi:hypothetical protein
MTDKNCVRCIGVEFTPGFISNSHALERTPAFELKSAIGIKRDEPPLTYRVTGMPRARGR